MNRSWLRWTVPPGISLLVHAVLLSAIAYIGMQIRASSGPQERVAITELALPAPPSVPQQPETNDRARDEADPSARRLPTATPLPDAVQAQAATLEQPKPGAAPRMDPVTLEAMRESTQTIAQPQSAAPPRVRFAGVQSKAARTMVYVVDGSGATANSFAYLRAQLMSSIDRLSPTQRFQVVLFRETGDSKYMLAPINDGRLGRATPEHKQAVAQWLGGIASRGRSNPLDGLSVALSLKPDLVLLITRSIQRTEMGWAQGQREILATLNELNPADEYSGQRATVIKAVQLLDEDPTGIMKAIGTLHGDGSDDYRVVRYDDLVSPDEPESIEQRSIGASDEQRIANAARMWGELAQSSNAQAALSGIIDDDQRAQCIDSARRVLALVNPLRDTDGRAELLWAKATLLLGKARPEGIEPQQLRSIIDRLGSVLYTDPLTDAQRVITVAVSRAQLGETEQARASLTELIALSDDLGLDALTRAQALLVLVSLGEEPESLSEIAAEPPFITPGGGIDAMWGLQLRECVTIARLKRGRANAWSPMLSIRAAAGASESIVAYIDERIALIDSQHGTDREGTAPRVLMAIASARARSISSREEAIALYQRAAETSDDPELIADALWGIGVLGRAISSDESIEQSNRALTGLARRFPDDRRALGAISSAIGTSGPQDAGTLRERLSLAIELFPESPAIDLWRLQLGELREGFVRLDTLDPITPETREGVLAGELYEQTVLGMLDRYDDSQTRLGLVVRMRDAALRFGLSSAEMWTKRVAMSEAINDPQSALTTIDQLIDEARSQNKPTDELELLRAQTLLGLGQTRSAFAALREFSARIDASGNRTSTYWQSWTLMIEAVAEQGNESEQRDAHRHIVRLRLIDPLLGGSPWRERINDADETLHSEP